MSGYKPLDLRETWNLFFFAAIAVLAGVSFNSYRSLNEFDNHVARVQHTHQVLNSIQTLLTTIGTVESDARGYSLTGDRDHLAYFESHTAAVQKLTSDLSSLTTDNPEQQKNIEQIKTLVFDRIALSRALIQSKQNIASPADVILVNDGKKLMDKIRTAAAKMSSIENWLLAERASRQHEAATTTRNVIFLGSTLSLVILITVYLLLRRQMQERAEAQKKLQSYADEVEDLYNNAPCGYLSTDSRGVILRANNTGLRWLGYERDELIEKIEHIDLINPEMSTAFMAGPFLTFMEKKHLPSTEVEYIRKDGTVLHAEISATSSLDERGNIMLSRIMISDITERKQAEQRIEALHVDLKQRATQLEITNKELESFSYSVSHDLRAPLRGISGYAMMLQDTCSEKLGEEGNRFLDNINKNIRKMDELINGLLRLAKLGRDAVTFMPVDMKDLARQAWVDVAGESDSVEFVLQDIPSAQVNPMLFSQVWTNLLSNAVKFSAKNSHPSISVSAREEKDGVVFCVSDNGTGFDQRYAGKLFGLFQRLHGEDQFVGSGIGLAIVHRIVTLHGGRIWAESQLNQGANFYFRLPVLNSLPDQI